MGFKIEGLTEFENKLIEMIDEKYPKMIDGLVNELGDRLIAKVKKKTPVGVTGNLKRTWEKSELLRGGKNASVTIFNNTEYAPHVEYGHRTRNHKRFIPGKYMLKRSVEELNKDTAKIVKKWLIKTLKDVKL